MTKVGWYAIDKSTPLESNKSQESMLCHPCVIAESQHKRRIYESTPRDCSIMMSCHCLRLSDFDGAQSSAAQTASS
jgi:hypothetical protein